jgi:hypothetical protein
MDSALILQFQRGVSVPAGCYDPLGSPLCALLMAGSGRRNIRDR